MSPPSRPPVIAPLKSAEEDAVELAGLYEGLGDFVSVSRVHKRAHRRRMRLRLANLYRRSNDYPALASILSAWAGSEKHPAAKVALLSEAASVYSDSLADPAQAVPLLRRALELAPQDGALKTQLAKTVAAADQPDD